MKPSGSDDAEPSSRRDLIMSVALDLFARYGVKRTRMEDIADEAGVSRPVVYIEFASRSVLIDAVLAHQLSTVASETGPKLVDMNSLPEAIVEGSVMLISALRAHPATLEMLIQVNRGRLLEIVQDPPPFTYSYVRSIWQPVLASAREREEIRPHLQDDDEIAAWISTSHVPYLVREAPDFDRLRDRFRQFVVPAICIEAVAFAPALPPQRARRAAKRTPPGRKSVR
jgi:AcrR family transcriptional regulator